MSDTPWAIGYARVSTPKQAVDGDSLRVQAQLIAKAIHARGLELVPDSKVLEEPFTGTTDDRPVYSEALAFIKKHPGRVKYFVVRSIDRFSREGSFRYQEMKRELEALGVQLTDVDGVIQPVVNSLAHLNVSYKWSKRSPSAITEVVLAEAGSNEVSTILTRLIGTQIGLVREGFHIGPADDGYVVKRTRVAGKKRCIQVVDPERAPFYQLMFEMRAEQTYSDKQIVEHINRLGFQFKPKNKWDRLKTTVVGRIPPKPLTVKALQSIILRSVYCGVILEKWNQGEPVRAAGGQAIVSIETFNRANRGKRFIRENGDGTLKMFYDYRPELVVEKRSRFNRRWLFKNAVICPVCEKPLYASSSRSRSGDLYGFYHCNRGHKRYSVPQATLDDAYTGFLDKIRFEESAWDRTRVFLKAAYRKTLTEKESLRRHTQKTIEDVEMEKTRVAEAFTAATSKLMRETLEKKLDELEKQGASLEVAEESMDLTEAELDEFVEHAERLLEHPGKVPSYVEDMREQSEIFGLLFSRLPTFEEIGFGTPLLSAAFTVFPVLDDSKTSVVRNTALAWNHISQEIKRWQAAYPLIDRVYERMKSGSC